MSAAVSAFTARLGARTYTSGPDSGSIATSLEPTEDGGYIVAGYSEIYEDRGGTVGVLTFPGDAWVLKLDEALEVRWQKKYGGPDSDAVSAIRRTRDGGYVVAGWTASFGAGGRDLWVLELDAEGGLIWQNTYGESGAEEASAIEPTGDGGYIVAGATTSFGSGEGDFWVVKLSSEGTLDWQRAYGGLRLDEASSIDQTSDGGFVVAGTTRSLELPDQDVWVLKLAADGEIGWQKAYGGRDDDRAAGIQQTSDGGYVVAATTSSFGAGYDDAWVLKLTADGEVSWGRAYGGEWDDSATSLDLTGDGGYVLAGSREPQNGYVSVWVLRLAADGAVS